ADVRAAVEDYEPMLERCRESARALESKSAPGRREDLAEVRAFLAWLEDNHFIYLGYAYCRYSGPLARGADSAHGGVRFVREPGLGILRDPGRSMFDVFEPPREDELCRVLKANRRSTVHRPVHLDTILLADRDE